MIGVVFGGQVETVSGGRSQAWVAAGDKILAIGRTVDDNRLGCRDLLEAGSGDRGGIGGAELQLVINRIFQRHRREDVDVILLVRVRRIGRVAGRIGGGDVGAIRAVGVLDACA